MLQVKQIISIVFSWGRMKEKKSHFEEGRDPGKSKDK